MQVQSSLDYCAGVVDAAGSIRGQQMKRADRPNDTYRMVVSVVVDNSDVLDILAKLFGGRVKRETAGRTLPVYRWALTNRESLNQFVSKMKGRLHSLEPQLEVLEEFLQTTAPIHGRRGASHEEIQHRRELFRKLYAVNLFNRGIDSEEEDNGRGAAPSAPSAATVGRAVSK